MVEDRAEVFGITSNSSCLSNPGMWPINSVYLDCPPSLQESLEYKCFIISPCSWYFLHWCLGDLTLLGEADGLLSTYFMLGWVSCSHTVCMPRFLRPLGYHNSTFMSIYIGSSFEFSHMWLCVTHTSSLYSKWSCWVISIHMWCVTAYSITQKLSF